MKKLMYSLTVAALFAVATLASANDLHYEQDHQSPDDPIPTEDAIGLGGTSGVADTSESGDVGGYFNQLNNWVALVLGTIVTLPNRSQVIG